MVHMSSRCEDGLPGVKMSLQGLFVQEEDCWDLCRTNSPTSARHEDGLGFIRIWATPPRRLVFWDGVPSPCTCLLQFDYQSVPLQPQN